MGWKGTVRSIGAAARRAERESRRRQRELERRQKEHQKMLALEQAAFDVEVFENLIERLTTMHHDAAPVIDWRQIEDAAAPTEPKLRDSRGVAAQEAWASFKPSMMDKVLGRAEQRKEELFDAITVAQNEDRAAFDQATRQYEDAYVEWELDRQFARRVLDGDADAWLEVVQDLNPFEEIAQVGSEVSISVGSGGVAAATIRVRGDSTIPSQKKALLQSGKLSTKKMPKGEFNELYQDSVCSAALRVANDLFSLLPTDMVIATAVDNMLDTGSGHMEEQPVLSVAIPRRTLNQLNLSRVDPSDSMSNFVHRMDFKRTKGLAPVERLTPDDLEQPQE